jgi:signal transduction histidine kinase
MTNELNQVDLKTRVAKTVILASIALFLVIIINDSLIGLIGPALIKLPVVFLFLWAYWLLHRIGFRQDYTHLVNLPVLFFFSVNYFTNHGTDGPTLLGMSSLFVIYPILLTKVWKWIYTSFTLLLIGVLLYFGTEKANLITPYYASAEEQFVDHFATAIVVGVYVSVVVSIVIRLYRRQNQRLTSAQSVLAKQLKLVETEKERNALLLGILAHDVKGPVSNLRQLVELRDQLNNSPELINKLFNDVGKRLNDVGSTIDNVLEKTKIAITRNDDAEGSPVQITDSLLRKAAHKFGNKQQEIRFNHSGIADHQCSLGNVSAEVDMILRNLIDNACKYAPSHTVISIDLKFTEGQVCWQITNDGEIPRSLQSQLFSKSVTSKEGTGVGLFLCKSMADQIGADLSFTTHDNYTIFHLKVAASVRT